MTQTPHLPVRYGPPSQRTLGAFAATECSDGTWSVDEFKQGQRELIARGLSSRVATVLLGAMASAEPEQLTK